jgi:hypothetical protein
MYCGCAGTSFDSVFLFNTKQLGLILNFQVYIITGVPAQENNQLFE